MTVEKHHSLKAGYRDPNTVTKSVFHFLCAMGHMVIHRKINCEQEVVTGSALKDRINKIDGYLLISDLIACTHHKNI